MRGNLFLTLLLWIVFAILGEYLVGYILSVFFGDITPWLGVPAILRYPIGLVFCYPIIVISVITFIAALFVTTPFF